MIIAKPNSALTNWIALYENLRNFSKLYSNQDLNSRITNFDLQLKHLAADV